MKGDKLKQIELARSILGLGEEATLAEIQKTFRRLSLSLHPDRCPEKDKKACEEEFKKIGWAKAVIARYCANYRYSFRPEDIRRNTEEGFVEDHLRRFYEGWL